MTQETDWKIGSYEGLTNLFNGQIANVAIYNDVRTPSEIQTDFLNGYVDTTDANLVSYYPLAGEFSSGVYKDVAGSNNGSCSAGTTCPTVIKDIYRPQPQEPAQVTLDLTTGFATSSEQFYYRTFFTTTDVASAYALDEITLDYTEEGATAAALNISSEGRQIESTGATTNVDLGGVFMFDSYSATTTIESINIAQNGSIPGDSITDITLDYIYVSTSTPETCESSKPESGLTEFGSSASMTNGSTTIDADTDLEIGPGYVGCVYVTYSLDTISENYDELGKTIDLGINASSSVVITEAEDIDVVLNSEPLSPYGSTILSQTDIPSLTVRNSDDSQTTIYAENGILFKKTDDAEPIRLTGRDVSVVYADFQNLTDEGERGQVRVELRIKFTGPNYVGSEVTQTFITTVNVGR
jgi:hypothetical protein